MGNSGSAVDMNGPEAEFIKAQISQSCVVIFSKASCPYCRACLKTFSKLEVEPCVIDLNRRQDGSILQDILENMTGARTVSLPTLLKTSNAALICCTINQ